MDRSRVRIRFEKRGDLRLISHRDLMRTLERLFRRAGITLAMSEGFHPKPRMSLPSALALGIVGIDEVLEIDLAEAMAPEALLAALNAQAPEGLSFRQAETVPPGAKHAQPKCLRYEVLIPAERQAEVADRVERLLSAGSAAGLRANSDAGTLAEPVAPGADMRSGLEELALDGGVLRVALRVSPQGGLRLRDVLAALELADLEASGTILTRSGVELQP